MNISNTLSFAYPMRCEVFSTAYPYWKLEHIITWQFQRIVNIPTTTLLRKLRTNAIACSLVRINDAIHGVSADCLLDTLCGMDDYRWHRRRCAVEMLCTRNATRTALVRTYAIHVLCIATGWGCGLCRMCDGTAFGVLALMCAQIDDSSARNVEWRKINFAPCTAELDAAATLLAAGSRFAPNNSRQRRQQTQQRRRRRQRATPCLNIKC